MRIGLTREGEALLLRQGYAVRVKDKLFIEAPVGAEYLQASRQMLRILAEAQHREEMEEEEEASEGVHRHERGNDLAHWSRRIPF